MVLFFLTSQKNAAGPKGQAFKASHEEAQVSGGTQKAGVFTKHFFHYQLLHEILLSVSIIHILSVCVCFFLVCCFVRSAWNGSGWTEVSVRVNHIHLFVMKYGWVLIFFLVESTSTVNFNRFFAEINGQCDIDRTFQQVNPYQPSISIVFSSRWILIDCRYRPCVLLCFY